MVTRRSFLLLLGAAFGGETAGLWLPEVGIVEVPRRMVLALSGTCSFCAAVPPAALALAGAVGRAERICGGCIDLSLTILGESAEARPRTSRTGLLLDDLGEPERSHVERLLAEMRDGTSRRIERADLRAPPACDFSDPKLLEALGVLRQTSTLMATTPDEQIDVDLLAAHGKAQEEVSRLLGRGWPGPFNAPPSYAELKAAHEARIDRRRARPPLQVLPPVLACTFCDAPQGDVVKLIAGPRVFICNDCVAEAAGVLAQAPQA